MQEFQKLITPGHVTGHRVRAVMRPLYAPSVISYAAGAILAVCAISGAGGHAVTMPGWFDRALTANQAAYQKAADDRAAAREKASQEAARAALAAQQATATTDAADQASQPPAQAAAPAPSSKAVSPALTDAIAAIMNLPTPKKSVDAVMNSRQIDMILNPLIRNDPSIADAVSEGMTECVKEGERMGNESLAAAPNRVIPAKRMVEILDYRRTCARDLLTRMAKEGQ